MWLFRKRKPGILQLSRNDWITIGQLAEGGLAIGGTGSGKSSSLMHLMRALMRSGAGMLFLTAKVDDYEAIRRLARMEGREADLIRFAPDADPFYCFDFLDFEINAPGGGVASASQFMQDLVDYSSRSTTMNSNEPFWPIAAARKIRMALIAIYHALGGASVDDVFSFCNTMAATIDQLKSKEWENTACAKFLSVALDKLAAKGITSSDFNMVMTFVRDEWPRLSDKTGGCIDAYVMNLCEKFMHSSVKRMVASGQSNITPDAIINDRKLVVIDTPVLKYREPGQFVQMVWKLALQRACLRRVVTPESHYVCCWADEAQLHALPSVDSMVQAVARSQRLINVAITQNIPLLNSVLKNKDDVLAWLSNLQTKFIFANGDKDTNDYFSALLGASKHFMGSINSGNGQFDYLKDMLGIPQEQGSFSCQETYLPDVRSEEFTRLRKGGKENNLMVDCYVFQGGRRFSTGRTWLKTSFRQMAP